MGADESLAVVVDPDHVGPLLKAHTNSDAVNRSARHFTTLREAQVLIENWRAPL
jgi:hypothetical protein